MGVTQTPDLEDVEYFASHARLRRSKPNRLKLELNTNINVPIVIPERTIMHSIFLDRNNGYTMVELARKYFPNLPRKIGKKIIHNILD